MSPIPPKSSHIAGYRPETSSATILAAGCNCLASATLCPAHNERASTSPVVPTIGAAVSYRTIGSPSAKCAMTSPTPGRLPSWGRPAASHALAVELRSTRWGASGDPTSYRLGYHCTSVSAASTSQPRRLSAQREHGSHSASVPDPVGRDHRHRCHRVHHGGHQGERRDLTPHVPASLPPLRHDDIDSATSTPLAAARRASSALPIVCKTSPLASWTCST